MTISKRHYWPVADNKRQAYSVRYPWEGWGDTYAHRSLADGLGEPNYNLPQINMKKRRFLSPKNNKMRQLHWKHTHTWNFTQGQGEGADGWIADRPDPWWGDNRNPHPINTGSVNSNDPPFLSPQPLTDVAWYARRTQASMGANSWWTIPGSTTRIPYIEIFDSPPAIAEEMAWHSQDTEPEIFDVLKKCERILIYKNLYHVNGTIVWAPSPAYPNYVLRSACSDGNGNTLDPRWEPFGMGWADILGQNDFSSGYEIDNDQDGPRAPAHESPLTDWADGDFDTADIDKISASKISSGFVYSANREFFTWESIENERPFDLIVLARFYKYKWYKYDSSAPGEGMEKMVLWDEGFAGAYGECTIQF